MYCNTLEKELLSIVETFKEFRSLLLGSQITVFTDHKNLTHQLTKYQTQQVLQCRLYIEEYQPEFRYIKVTKNALSNALSRIPQDSSLVGENDSSTINTVENDQTEILQIQLFNTYAATESFLFNTQFDEQNRYPLSGLTIHEYQA